MKKGFTLVELLVVMVIVTILVTMALPKYKAAMEKGRGLEGVVNAGVLSDTVNSYYVMNGNSYGCNSTTCEAAAYAISKAPMTKATYFNYSITDDGTGTLIPTAVRTGLSAERTYTIFSVNSNGEETERYCTGYQRYCNAIGANIVRTAGGWNF